MLTCGRKYPPHTHTHTHTHLGTNKGKRGDLIQVYKLLHRLDKVDNEQMMVSGVTV